MPCGHRVLLPIQGWRQRRTSWGAVEARLVAAEALLTTVEARLIRVEASLLTEPDPDKEKEPEKEEEKKKGKYGGCGNFLCRRPRPKLPAGITSQTLASSQRKYLEQGWASRDRRRSLERRSSIICLLFVFCMMGACICAEFM